MRWQLLWKHNEPHKPAGMQQLMERAVAAHGTDLAAAWGPGKEVKFIFGTEVGLGGWARCAGAASRGWCCC